MKLYIFSFETKLEDFQLILNIYEKRDLHRIKEEDFIDILEEKENFYLKDNIIIEKTPIEKYFEEIFSKIDELNNIFDRTQTKMVEGCFNLIETNVKNKIIEFSKSLDLTKIDTILPELYLINKVKLDLEIESGLLFCNQCKRWYPIIDTIPQMLPDEYRDEKKELEFLKSKKNLLDKEFFNQNLKPFNL